MSWASFRTVDDAPTAWFTGLPGAGMTTIARAVAAILGADGIAHALLDGHEQRATLSADSADPGFTREDRAEQVRRLGLLAQILGDAGDIPLGALVSPFRADRDGVCALHTHGWFVEVHVATTLEALPRTRPQGPLRALRRPESRRRGRLAHRLRAGG